MAKYSFKLTIRDRSEAKIRAAFEEAPEVHGQRRLMISGKPLWVPGILEQAIPFVQRQMGLAAQSS